MDSGEEPSMRELMKDMQQQAQSNYDNLAALIGGIDDKLQAFDTRLQGFDTRLHDAENKVDAMDSRSSQQGKALNIAQRDISDLQKDSKSQSSTLTDMKKLLDSARGEIDKLREWNNKLERFSRRNNLRLVGIEEKREEDVYKIVTDVLKDKFSMTDVEIERAHRVGKPSDGNSHGQNAAAAARTVRTPGPRHIIFKLLSYKDKVQILKQKREKLARKKYYITDDETDEDMATKRRLQPVINKAKEDNKKWRFTQGKLFIDGELYRERRGQPSTGDAANAGAGQ